MVGALDSRLLESIQLEAFSIVDFPAVVQQLGSDPYRIAARCGVDLDSFGKSGSTIEYESYCLLLEEAARETGKDHFGLLLGQGHDIDVLGWIKQFLTGAETLGELIELVVQYFNLVSRGEVIEMETWAKQVALIRVPIVAKYAHSVQAQDATITEAVQTLRGLLPHDWSPQGVYLSHTPLNEEPYTHLFRCPVHFGEPLQAITVSTADLALPIQKLDNDTPSAMHQGSEEDAERISSNWRKSLKDEVRGHIQIALARGNCNVNIVAAGMGMHSRTLHRKLERENVSFSDLLDETRRELSHHYVAATPMSFSEVSHLLGYSDATAFSRAFKRWFAMQPSSYRKNARAGL